ncbi:hypothetical protein [Streptomyces sp. NPDC059788]|uniref:hypothetical protein n=1 Tax=Streptomyces sp. NPDC059788 TaxID=3346948 RepID=UPI00364A3CE2
MLAVLLVAAFALVTASESAARHKKPARRISSAAFDSSTTRPPDRFVCDFVHKRHEYMCHGVRSTRSFELDKKLTRGGDNTIPGEGWEGIAAPDRFDCRWIGTGPRTIERFDCNYTHRHTKNGRKLTHWFMLHQMVSVTDNPDPSADDPSKDQWVAPHFT